MDASQRRELREDMWRSTGSYELVVSPLLLGLIGWFVDGWLGTTPVLTVAFTVIGVAGAAVKLYYGYKLDMDEHEMGAPWAKR